MDIEENTLKPAYSCINEDNVVIAIHPMALVGIADHHTRIFVSGTASCPDSFATGLLFGFSSDTNVTIVDAEEVDFTHPSKQKGFHEGGLEELEKDIRAKVGLHTQVFPKHTVLGWYKVVNDYNRASEDFNSYDEIRPNCHDLNIHHLVGLFSNRPLFLLMNACSASAKEHSRVIGTGNLPVFIFETNPVENEHESQFVIKEFVLEASEPEKISVERVSNDISLPFGISSISSRLHVIIEYLNQVRSGAVEPNHAIMRDISMLIDISTLIGISSQNIHLDVYTQMELYLSSIAKITMCLHNLTSKFNHSEKRLSMRVDK